MESHEEKSALEQAIEAFVFAPVGLFLAARDEIRRELPHLIEMGREQTEKQITLARMMGKYAVEEAQKDASKRVEQAVELIESLRGAGPSPPPQTQPRPQPAASTAQQAAPDPAPANAAPDGGSSSTNGSAPPPAADSLAIPGYGALSASQVVQRLAGLDAEQLEAVRTYEATTRARKTILGRIAQLQTDSA